jgi:hypothetical protein
VKLFYGDKYYCVGWKITKRVRHILNFSLTHEKYGILTKYRTSRRIKWAGLTPRRGRTKMHKMWSEDFKEWYCMGDVGVNWRIILRWSLRK